MSKSQDSALLATQESSAKQLQRLVSRNDGDSSAVKLSNGVDSSHAMAATNGVRTTSADSTSARYEFEGNISGNSNIHRSSAKLSSQTSANAISDEHGSGRVSIDPELDSINEDAELISSITASKNQTSTPIKDTKHASRNPRSLQDMPPPPPAAVATDISSRATESSSDTSASISRFPNNSNQEQDSHAESPIDSKPNTRKRKLSSLGMAGFSEEELSIPFSELLEKIQSSDSDGLLHLSDRSKQLFAFAWLEKYCEEAPEATVPRSRVYARYVSLCSELTMRPLTPATFGKAVKARFPNIKTKRLGTRGQSKYNYCGVRLVGESDMSTPYYGTPVKFIGNDSPDTYGSFRSSYYNSSNDYSFFSNSPYNPSRTSTSASGMTLLANSNGHATSTSTSTSTSASTSNSNAAAPITVATTGSPNDDDPNDISKVLTSDARLSTPAENRLDTTMGDVSLFDDINIPILNGKRDFAIPNLEAYLEEPADPDDVNILYGLYKAYCHSIMDNLRFMQIGKLFKTIQVFVSGMTLTVQRLLARPSVYRWAASIDWALYKEMVQLLNRLIFDEIPVDVSRRLKTLARNLPIRIEQSLVAVHMPAYFIDLKLESARGFVSVLDRMLRANDASIHAGKILSNTEELARMKRDWNNHVERDVIASREVPCEFAKVLKILDVEVPNLLDSSAQLTSQESVLSGSPERLRNPDLGGQSQDILSQQEILETEFIHFKPDDSKPEDGKPEDCSKSEDNRPDIGTAHQRRLSKMGKIVDDKNLEGGFSSYDQQSTQLLRWAEFLSSLPDIFATIPPRVFLLSVSAILTCALKDISVNGGESFGAWWVVRIWVDEWLGWRAEMGGFLSRGGEETPVFRSTANSIAGNVDAFVNGADYSNFRLSFPLRVSKDDHQASNIDPSDPKKTEN